jgi:hypothetical protein
MLVNQKEEQKNIPKKVIGVIADEDHHQLSTLGIKSDSSITTFENGYEIVNNWEKIYKMKIKGRLRSIGEYVATQNLQKKFPTNKNIRTNLNIKREYCKKLLTKARRIGLLSIHQKRSGHQYRYYITNIRDHIIQDDDSGTRDPHEDLSSNLDLKMQLIILDDLMSRTDISFHHINLKSKLKEKDDYNKLRWNLGSNENRGKIFNLKISTYRRCSIVVYPNGTVNMMIKCSNHPLYLGKVEDMTNFFAICGEILNVIKAETNNSEPLADDVSNWTFTQFDASFDIPVSELNKANKRDSDGKGRLSLTFFGVIHLKSLGQLYQIYSKNILQQGNVLRIEKRFSFLEFQPTVDILKNKFMT